MPAPERLRVLFVLAGSAGGIGRHVATLAAALTGRGHTVSVVGPPATEETFGFRAAGADFIAGGSGVLGAFDTRGAVRAAARAADVTHAHGVRAAVVAAAAGVRPLVVTWHNAPVGRLPRRARHAAAEIVAARAADLTLTASEDLLARARRAGARRAVLAPVAAAPLGQPDRSPAEVRAQLGVAERPVILAVARLQRQKRLDLLVQASRGWADHPDGPVVVVAGDGPLEGRLRAAAAAARSPLLLLGRREDVADLLGAADVAVLSSDWEARALFAQEALRCGVPLVTTAVGGMPGLVGDAAVLVPPRDPRALRRALAGLLADPDRRGELRRRGVERAGQWPTVEEMVDDLTRHYLDLCSRAR